jgi:hypothetical protein
MDMTDEVEISQVLIPKELYELKQARLIELLLEIDEVLFPEDKKLHVVGSDKQEAA